MFKQLVTLVRGRAADTSQTILDANALALLRQQMREAAHGVDQSRKAVAVVMAYSEREKASLKSIGAQIADLETRALEALENGREDLATGAASTIAKLETERDITLKAIETYQSQITRLKQCLSESENCLRELKQGQHLAEANAKAYRVSGVAPSDTTNGLKDAKSTLNRLQEQQEYAQAKANALAELSINESAEDITKRLAEGGFGAPQKTDANSVLERLKKKAAPAGARSKS